jgi:TPR repeat protein
MKHLYSLVLAIALLVGSVSVATAQDLQKGFAAWQAGDFATALQEWTPLADRGVAIAQFSLGLMYRKGDGVPQDYAEAVRRFRLAADQGVAIAQFNLGLMYANGQGVLQDNVMAHMWYNIASANGVSKAGEWRDELAGLMTQADISNTPASVGTVTFEYRTVIQI